MIVFGGTFDPPHVGHLAIAQLALEQANADAVWLLPAPTPPHKQEQALPYELRVDLCRALVADHAGLTVSTFESQLKKPSYTVDTVRALRKAYPETQFEFLLGSDSLAQLPTWDRARELTLEISFLVAVRSAYPLESTLSATRRKLPEVTVRAVEIPILDVSSSWLRERRQNGLPLCSLVPERVLRAWEAHG